MSLFPQISLPYIYVDFGIHISSPEALLRSAMTSPLLPLKELKELKVALPLAVTWRMGRRFLPVVVKLPVLSTRHREFFMNLQLVGGLVFYDFPYFGNSNPNWLSYFFQRGWNHQPDMIGSKFLKMSFLAVPGIDGNVGTPEIVRYYKVHKYHRTSTLEHV